MKSHAQGRSQGRSRLAARLPTSIRVPRDVALKSRGARMAACACSAPPRPQVLLVEGEGEEVAYNHSAGIAKIGPGKKEVKPI